MYHKIAAALACLAMLVLVAACAAAKPDYRDVKAALAQEVASIVTFISAVEKAGTAQAQADAVNAYVDSFKVAMVASNAAMAKHAELKDKSIPLELQESFAELNGAAFASADAVTKIKTGAFASDPLVTAALARMATMAQ